MASYGREARTVNDWELSPIERAILAALESRTGDLPATAVGIGRTEIKPSPR
jgi:hypothetical protein